MLQNSNLLNRRSLDKLNIETFLPKTRQLFPEKTFFFQYSNVTKQQFIIQTEFGQS